MSHQYANAKYMTIAEHIAQRLRAGDFLTGEPFYSRDELARAYHISPGTARAILRVLEDRGVIACRKGKRPVPAGFMTGISMLPVCRPVFCRDSRMAETSEYDYLAYCARNILMRQKSSLLEHDLDFTEYDGLADLSGGDVAVLFPPAHGETAPPPVRPDDPGSSSVRAAGARIRLLFDQIDSNAVSVFTGKARPDCTLHLIRQNAAATIRVASSRSAFPWFQSISEPDTLNAYLPDCKSVVVPFDGELETFPDFLAESVPAAAPGRTPVAVLIDDPYLSDCLSGEIRVGAYHPPSWCFFFGTALNQRSMVFPYLDLRLDELAAAIVRTAASKAENPTADLACEFHLTQFRDPGIG